MHRAAASKSGRRTTAAIAALGLSLTMAACGGGGDGAEDGPAASAVPKSGGTTIDMVDLEFSPRSVTVERGETVTFVNKGKVTHNAKGKSFFSRVVEPGGSYRTKFNEPGTFKYLCTFHPGMEGTLKVR